MRFLIIGLGIYGYNLATDLTAMGHEVIGADQRPAIIENIKDNISTAYILDSTDEAALAVLPLKNVDIVIVAIGENFGASVKTVAILKKLGVKHIYARAMDDLHYNILESFKVDRILTPEQRAAKDLVYELALGSHVETMQIDANRYIVKFTVPEYFVGMRIADVDFLKSYGVRLLAISRPQSIDNIIGVAHDVFTALKPDEDNIFCVGDLLTCMGTLKGFRSLIDKIN